MPFASVNGIQLFFEQAGQGQPLLFISGTGSDLRVRPNVLDGPLADAFSLVAFDQRGLGQSDKPRDEYCMSLYADDAAGLVEALGLGPLPVVGVSFGGMVAQELALRHPHCVSRLVLCCTSAGGAGGASYPLHELAALADEERIERHLVLSDTRRTSSWRESNSERWRKLKEVAASAVRPDRDEDGARRQLDARAHHDTFDRLPSLNVPTLIAAGLYDGIALPQNALALARAIPNAALRFYQGGHLFLMQDKSAYSEIVRWLESSSSHPSEI